MLDRSYRIIYRQEGAGSEGCYALQGYVGGFFPSKSSWEDIATFATRELAHAHHERIKTEYLPQKQ